MVRRTVKKLIFFVAITLALFADGDAQRGEETRPNPLETEIRDALKEILGHYAALDSERSAKSFAAGGFFFHSLGGYSNTEATIAQMRADHGLARKRSMKFNFELEDLNVSSLRDDVAVVNYTVVNTIDENGEKMNFRERTTNVLVKVDGRWKIFADHTSRLPNLTEPSVAGMPLGWVRGPSAGSEGYSITVDESTRRSGRSSAAIKNKCGNEMEFGSIMQVVDAAEYVGKRIRLSGWIRTDGADSAGLWMRIDGDKRTLGFDNMQDRPIKATTPWRKYSIVLDVPVNAVNINFGALLIRQGVMWIDDLALEIVGTGTATTNMLTDEQMKIDDPNREPVRSGRKQPVNMNFEEGKVQP